MDDNLEAYLPTKERIKKLKKDCKHYENFMNLEQVLSIYSESKKEIEECKKSGVRMNKLDELELYHANLEYYYKQI